MRSGRLRSRITIQKQINRKDDFGQNVDEWLDVCTCRAEIRDSTGKEYQNSQIEQSQTDCRVLIRYIEGITPDMRIVHQNSYYDIKAVLENIKKTQLELMCIKGVRYD